VRRRVLLLASLVLAACATAQPFPVPDGPYGEALDAATRSAVVRSGLSNELIAFATFDSPTYVAARREKVSYIRKVPLDEADACMGPVAAPATGPAFFVSVYTNLRPASAIDRPDNLWAVALETPAGTFRPVAVKRLFPDATLRTLYPYIDPFSLTFRVTFPPEAAAGPHRLVFSGPAGSAGMAFAR
jgi:hypothetical protein